jgi:bifunctional UDP-N-acetylglucosamine pyrophosphorylase/glucosamine-1-phosphate N-acetyltransferase
MREPERYSRDGGTLVKQAAAIVLAAGEGTRMRSALPKVAHQILGVPLVRYVVDAARTAGVGRVVTVVGHGAEAVAALVGDTEIAVQDEQLGTGHAVRCAEKTLDGFDGPVLVLAGDVPLLRPETLIQLVERFRESEAACVLLTARFPDPTGYGRIVRDDHDAVSGIIEQRDLSPEQLVTDECNAGVYCFDGRKLFSALDRITPHNAQGEYYLTDVVAILRADGFAVQALTLDDPDESHGINTRVQLAHAARLMQRRINEEHMLAGVTMTDPTLVWIGPKVTIGRDVVILPMTQLDGATSVADDARIGPSTRILDSVIESGAVVEQSIVRGARIGECAMVGPNAYVRPGTVLGPRSKAGSFVEIKNSTIGEGSKVPHLSYVGDAAVGAGVNIGAGSITCNYDGHDKHATVIGDGAFIGSATMLVAPVEVGANAMTAAGSAIAKDVPAGALGIERAEQKTIEGWARRRKTGNDE